MMGPPPQRRQRDHEITPPRRASKRADGRSSAERGIRKDREEDFRTPMRHPDSADSSESSRGLNDAPLRVRRLRLRPDFLQDEETRDAEMTDSLANMLTNCAKLE